MPVAANDNAEPPPPPPQQFFPQSIEQPSPAATGSDDGREQQPEDGRPRSRQTETDTQAADGSGLDVTAVATVAEEQKKAETGSG